jgi:hypothetical protein
MVTTIQIHEKTKALLDKIKVYHRETYDELVRRLMNFYSKNKDNEAVEETLEIISDPEAMREIAEGLEAYESGKGKSLKKLREELGV